MMARTMGTWFNFDVNGKPTPLQTIVFQHGYASWLSPINASLAYAITFVIFWYLILLFAQKRGIMLKV